MLVHEPPLISRSSVVLQRAAEPGVSAQETAIGRATPRGDVPTWPPTASATDGTFVTDGGAESVYATSSPETSTPAWDAHCVAGPRPLNWTPSVAVAPALVGSVE